MIEIDVGGIQFNAPYYVSEDKVINTSRFVLVLKVPCPRKPLIPGKMKVCHPRKDNTENFSKRTENYFKNVNSTY